MPLSESQNRKGVLICAFLYTFFFVGAFFGFGPLQLLLETEGIFASKCPYYPTNNEDSQQETTAVCPSQTTALVNISFYAQITQLVSPFLGQFVDHYGPHKIIYGMVTLNVSYLALAIIATSSQTLHWLWYPAYILSALSTWCGSLLQVPTAIRYAGDNERAQSRIIVGLNSVFDAGSITYLGLWALQQNIPRLSLTNLLLIYFILAVLIFSVSAYFWACAKPVQTTIQQADDDAHATLGIQTKEEEEEEEAVQDSSQSRSSHTFQKRESDATENLSNTPPITITVKLHQTEEAHETKITETINTNTKTPHDEINYILVSQRTTRQQLLSAPFLALLTFFVIHVTSNQFVLTTTRDFLAFLGDDHHNNRYLTIFTLLLPASLLVIPLVNIVIRRWGYADGGMQAVNILALGFWIVRLAGHTLNVQILGFVFFSFFRCFLFGVYFSFLASLLSSQIVGKAAGLSFCFAGATSFLNVPLTKFAVQTQQGDFFIPNLLYTSMLLPCMVLSWYLGRVITKEELVKARLADEKERDTYQNPLQS